MEKINTQRKTTRPSLLKEKGSFFSFTPNTSVFPFFQPKLTVNSPGDRYEREADAVADRVMSGQTAVQRKCDGCENEEDEKVQRKPLAEYITSIQRRETSGTAKVDSGAETAIDQSRSNGDPLSPDTQTYMEERFGTDFSTVKIHTDANAAQLNKQLNARAFTTGSDIFFNEGEFSSSTTTGRHLLAHELAHVVQQRSNTNLVQRDEAADKAAADAEAKKIADLIIKIKVHGLVSVDNGDADFTSSELELVLKALAGLPLADKAAIKGAKLVRVSSLGSSAGMYSTEQGFDDTTVTDEQKIELSNKAFNTGSTAAAETIRLITHEVGHAIAAMPHNIAEREAIKAGANFNKKINESTAAWGEFDTAKDDAAAALQELTDATDTFNNTDVTDKVARADAKKDMDAKRKVSDTLKASATAKETKAKTAEGASAAAKLVMETKDTASAAKLANIDDLKTDAATKLASMKAAYASASATIALDDADSADYRTAVTSAEDAIIKFYDENAAVDVETAAAETAKQEVDSTITDRNDKRAALALAKPGNAAITSLAPVEAAQDIFLKAAVVVAFNKAMNLSVKRFYDFVIDKGVSPSLTPYAADNWPHKPEEFYAEAYSFFVTRPKDLEAHSKVLYDWFVAGKYK